MMEIQDIGSALEVKKGGCQPPLPPRKGKGKGLAPPKVPAAKKTACKSTHNQNGSGESARSSSRPKTKQLGWRKLDSADEDTLWASHREFIDDIALEREDLEAVFCAAGSKPATNRGINSSAEERKTSEKFSVVSSTRTMGICIGIRCVKNLGPEHIRKAIYTLDPEELPAEATELLLARDPKTKQPTVLPIDEEIAAAQIYAQNGTPLEQLDEASRFVVAVHDIPMLLERLQFHQFRLSSDESIHQIRKQLAQLNDALHQVQQSERLARILILVLKAGNVLNDGTDRGNASAFHIDSLAVLTMLRGQVHGITGANTELSDPGTPHGIRTAPRLQAAVGSQALSLLDFLVGVISAQRPDLLAVAEDLPTLPEASRIDLADLQRSIAQLHKDLQKHHKTADAIFSSTGDSSIPRNTDPELLAGRVASTLQVTPSSNNSKMQTRESSDPGLQGVTEFLEKASQELSSLDEALRCVKDLYTEVTRFFGQKQAGSNITPVNEWLGHINRFVQELDKAHQAHRRRKEQEQKLEKQGSYQDKLFTCKALRRSSMRSRTVQVPRGRRSSRMASHKIMVRGLKNLPAPWVNEATTTADSSSSEASTQSVKSSHGRMQAALATSQADGHFHLVREGIKQKHFDSDCSSTGDFSASCQDSPSVQSYSILKQLGRQPLN